MGDKEEARAVAKKCNVPLTESLEGSAEEILEKASTLSYPVLIKAALGGGGKGMVKCKNAFELQHELPLVARQAQNYFGNGKVYVEQYLDSPRHIEIQVFGDHLGRITSYNVCYTKLLRTKAEKKSISKSSPLFGKKVGL